MSENSWEKDLNWQKHRESAQIIPNWKNTNKNDLIRMCVEYDRQGDFRLRDAVFSAIILKYWHKIMSNCYETKYNRFSMDDYYDWLVDSVWYAIKKTPWENPNNSTYNDPVGPDKVVSMRFKSLMKKAVQTSEYNKNILNYISDSLDTLNEMGFDFATENEESREESAVQVYTIIKNYFVSHKDFEALVLHIMYNKNVYTGSRVSCSKVADEICKLDADSFSATYGIEPSRIKRIASLNKKYLTQVIRDTINKLGRNKKLKECLSC